MSRPAPAQLTRGTRKAADLGRWPRVRPAPAAHSQRLRANTNIQGNILAGFNKDHQVLLFVAWRGQRAGRAWLATLRPTLATNKAVTDFNATFSAARADHGEPPDLAAVWTNISFTAAGIGSLAPRAIASLRDFHDPGIDTWLAEPWDDGLAEKLGDTAENSPQHWLFPRRGRRIDAVVCIAADRSNELDCEVARFRDNAARHHVDVVFEQAGETLRGQARGHEHFGFKDGISQPGIRGYDFPNPQNDEEVAGKPGTDLIAAGAFVLGYGRDARKTGLGSDLHVPKWMWDGSFLVTRRLVQDVPAFWGDVAAVYRQLIAGGVSQHDLPDPDALAARLVGRWRSGTPIARSPVADTHPPMGPDENNHFEFEDDTSGRITPLVAHIRKLYPRKGGPISDDDTKGRRILRRGIPFGPAFAPGYGLGAGLDAERGLVFQCYQASLFDQFAYLQQRFVNDRNFPRAGAGRDAVIGQGGPVTLRLSKREQHPTLRSFIRTQGSLLSFTPSLTTVDRLAAGAELPEA